MDFWRNKPGVWIKPSEVTKQLSAGKVPIEGLEELPTADFIVKISDCFADWARHDNSPTSIMWSKTEDGNGPGFEISITSQNICVDCYGLSNDEKNKLVDIGLEFDCPLYGPQIDERFDDYNTKTIANNNPTSKKAQLQYRILKLIGRI